MSLVTSPAHTRSHSAVSSTASSAVPAAATRSGQNGRARGRELLRGSRRAPARSGGSGSVTDDASSLHAVAEEQADPAVVGAERARAGPHELARRAQLVEHRGPVALDAHGEHVAFEHRHRDRDTLQLLERLDQRVHAPSPAADALPRRQEPHERDRVDRLDLVPERGERAAAQRPQHAGVAPLAFGAGGPELAVHDAARGFEPRRARRARARP